ncbi:hypothetical protein [Halalkalibacter urbisdiaboli]|uniref:hypothetical protein n=1 Tax=Halalkalibacter urbisdiaboli TaxID=1960589 RepID=UPI000B43C010|nr:hypothetical protein [Halalkalibacter urbisdiaboli]
MPHTTDEFQEFRECREELRRRRAILRECRQELSEARAERRECRQELRECRDPYSVTTIQNINA